jgi:DNA invertase Pin-like site-specific DNA recombinase
LVPQLAVAQRFVDRPGLTEVLKYARTRDTIVVHNLGRLGRNAAEPPSR